MSARVTVVGAGIAGASVAFALARKGASVTIVDDAATGEANIATGYGAVGLTVAPLIGDALARAIFGEPAPELAAFGAGGADVPGGTAAG